MSLCTAAKNALYSIDGQTYENIYMSLCTAAKNALYRIDEQTYENIYRVSHIKLYRVNGSKLRFGGQIRKFKKNESF